MPLPGNRLNAGLLEYMSLIGAVNLPFAEQPTGSVPKYLPDIGSGKPLSMLSGQPTEALRSAAPILLSAQFPPPPPRGPGGFSHVASAPDLVLPDIDVHHTSRRPPKVPHWVSPEWSAHLHSYLPLSNFPDRRHHPGTDMSRPSSPVTCQSYGHATHGIRLLAPPLVQFIYTHPHVLKLDQELHKCAHQWDLFRYPLGRHSHALVIGPCGGV